MQAGAFGEHRFTTASYTDDQGKDATQRIDGEYVEVELGPGTVLEVELGVQRFCRKPSYQQPWD